MKDGVSYANGDGDDKDCQDRPDDYHTPGGFLFLTRDDGRGIDIYATGIDEIDQLETCGDYNCGRFGNGKSDKSYLN